MLLSEVIVLKRNSKAAFLKEKSFVIVLALLIISAGTMTAMYQSGKDEAEIPNQEQQLAQVEESVSPREESKEEKETEDNIQKETTVRKTTEKYTTAQRSQSSADTILEPELESEFAKAPEPEALAEAGAESVIAENFSRTGELSLQWPVTGEIVLDYSMDHSVYFRTLAQFQYNPGMLIGTEEGTPVLAAADGLVTAVGKSDDIGHFVTMDLGGGFELTYGQLFEIGVAEGDVLEAGTQLAMVAYPTGYYVEEGESLYLKLTQDGVPVDPKMYLSAE